MTEPALHEEKERDHKAHLRPQVTHGMTTEEYISAYEKLHNAMYPGSGHNNRLLRFFRWMGDAALAVPPVNRFWCAVGLTTGLWTAGTLAKTVTGVGFDRKEIKKETVPSFLQPIYKKLPFDPNSLKPADRWKRFAMWATFSLGGFIGIIMGTNYAYKKTYEKNKHAEYLEDYIARTSQHQSDSWRPLAAFSGVFGSSAGYFMIPIPGLNYAMGIANRTTLMQDRKNMIPGFGDWWSGANGTFLYGAREGLQYMIDYAVNNPSRDPADLPGMVNSILLPLYGEKFTAAHLQRFTDEIFKIRDKYCLQEEGVLKKDKKALKAELQARFTKGGLETLLYDMGLDPRSITFTGQNGVSGKIGNTLGATGAIEKDQKAYHVKVSARLNAYEEQKNAIPAAPETPELTRKLDDFATPPKAFTEREDIAAKAPGSGHIQQQENRRQAPDGQMALAGA